MTTQKKRKLSGVKKISMKRNLNKKSKVNRSKKSRTNTKKKMKGGAEWGQYSRHARHASHASRPLTGWSLPGGPSRNAIISAQKIKTKEDCMRIEKFYNKSGGNKAIKKICKHFTKSSKKLKLDGMKKYLEKYYFYHFVGNGNFQNYYQTYERHQDISYYQAMDFLTIYEKYKNLNPETQKKLKTQNTIIKTKQKKTKVKKKEIEEFVEHFIQPISANLKSNNKLVYCEDIKMFVAVPRESVELKILKTGGVTNVKTLIDAMEVCRRITFDPSKSDYKQIYFNLKEAPEEIKRLFKDNLNPLDTVPRD